MENNTKQYPGVSRILMRAKQQVCASKIQNIWKKAIIAKIDREDLDICGICYDVYCEKNTCCNNYICDGCFDKFYRSSACENLCPFCKSGKIMDRLVLKFSKIVLPSFLDCFKSPSGWMGPHKSTTENTVGHIKMLEYWLIAGFQPYMTYTLFFTKNKTIKKNVEYERFRYYCGVRVPVIQHYLGKNLVDGFDCRQLKLTGSSFKRKWEWCDQLYNFKFGRSYTEKKDKLLEFIEIQCHLVIEYVKNYNRKESLTVFNQTKKQLLKNKYIYHPIIYTADNGCTPEIILVGIEKENFL